MQLDADGAAGGQAQAIFPADHRAGLDHADLNAHNLLFDGQQRGWMIDFDRSQLRIPATGWREANLQRLLRSLHKRRGARSAEAVEADFARLVNVMRPIAEQLESTEHGHPTEFELKTALAFLWFAEKAVDEGRLDDILVPRVSEVPSRSLRQITVDRGKGNVPERVVLTPTCELMQIVVLSRSMDEISSRVAAMIAGTKDGRPVVFGDFIDLWRITTILSDAVKPAQTSTLGGSPVYVHGGPFANVSIGIPTLVSVEMACALHDVVVVEAGYGTDAGAQKWLDIACREYGAQWPSAAVVVTRATTWRDDPTLSWRYPFHVRRLEGLGVPTFPLVNLWSGEDDQIDSLRDAARALGFREPVIGNLFRDGGDALAPQLDGFMEALEASTAGDVHADSHKGMPLVEDVTWVAGSAYGVPPERVRPREGFEESLRAAARLVEGVGRDIDDLALVAVKSPATMTDDDSAPEDSRTVTLKKVEVHAGAGLVQVNLTTSLTTPMPKIV